MMVLLLDAKDSFVDIIGQYLRSLGAQTHIVRTNCIDADAIAALAPDMIVLGPGPGHPSEAGYVPIVHRFVGKIPILGVCLGHQAIGLAFGAKVRAAEHLMHGKSSWIRHDGRGVFADLPEMLRVTRYHSLIVSRESIPPQIEVTATATEDGYVMGLRAPALKLESVQFHPESINTDHGMQMFRNFLRLHITDGPGYSSEFSVAAARLESATTKI